MSDAEFQNFHEFLRSGDAEAVERLLSDLDPFLRQVIRRQLFDRNARRIVDTADVLQSLLADFLKQQGTDQAAVSAGRLKGYLVAAARNKIASKARKERRRTADLDGIAEPASADPSSSQQVEDRDFVESLRNLLSEENRRLFELSQQGRTWRQIADEFGGRPDSLRIQLRRAIAAALAEIQ